MMRLFSPPAPDAGDAAVHLLCVPYAGGSTHAFRTWPGALPRLRLHLPQLPGRGRSTAEPLPESVEEVVDGLLPAVLDLPPGEIAIFGHSLGGLIGFELATRLEARGRPPVRFFASGSYPPGEPCRRIAAMPEPEFVALLKTLGATPREFFQDPDLLAFFLPVLRSDFILAETYAPEPGARVSCPLDVLYGTADPDVTAPRIASWRHRAAGAMTVTGFPGDHFFLHQAEEAVLRHVTTALESAFSTAAPEVRP